ncbi:hypothetical protein D3C72_2236020 [compost metagenome]
MRNCRRSPGCSRCQRERKNRCVTNTMNHANMAPNIEIDIISVSDSSGLSTLSTMATAMPRQETAIAPIGTPRLLTRPSAAGA